jgi:hypothetical protein
MILEDEAAMSDYIARLERSRYVAVATGDVEVAQLLMNGELVYAHLRRRNASEARPLASGRRVHRFFRTLFVRFGGTAREV